MRTVTSRLSLAQWIRANTQVPSWFPKGFDQAWMIYGLVVIAQSLAILATAGLLQLVPDFGFKGALFILGATFISHFLGTFSGMVASVVGTLLFDLFLTPPYLTLVPDKASDILSVLFYLVVCITISLLVKPIGTAKMPHQH